MRAAIIAIVIILLIGGGIAIFLIAPESEEDGETSTESGGETTSMTIDGTFADLAARGDELECAFAYEDEYSTQEGTIYVKGDMVRGEITDITNGTTANILRDGEYHYLWGTYDGEEVSIKTKLSEIHESEETGEAVADEYGLSDNYSFTCEEANLDSSMFEVPNRDFTDITETLQGLPEGIETFNEDACSTCDLVSGADAQEACHIAYSCE